MTPHNEQLISRVLDKCYNVIEIDNWSLDKEQVALLRDLRDRIEVILRAEALATNEHRSRKQADAEDQFKRRLLELGILTNVYKIDGQMLRVNLKLPTQPNAQLKALGNDWQRLGEPFGLKSVGQDEDGNYCWWRLVV